MGENTLVMVLALTTLLAFVAYGGWQYRKARLAKRRGDGSSLAHLDEPLEQRERREREDR
ncbi:MAG: hypothetical protein EA356_10545 [Geminicoccaceae bacterium]|nr:MAG: hypothetical protein EA356_10545 [Geminicoccaceae bacterium]